MLFKEIENHVAGGAVERRVHRHLAKEVFQSRDDHRERAEAVPKVVEREEPFAQEARALVFEGHERSTQLHRIAKVCFDKLLREMEHVRRGEHGLPLGVELHLPARQEAVAAQDLAVFGAPNNQLVVRRFAAVELVDVAVLSRSAAGCAEGNLAQAAHLAHGVGRFFGFEHIDFVACLIGGTQPPLGRKLCRQQVAVYGRYYREHIRGFFYSSVYSSTRLL